MMPIVGIDNNALVINAVPSERNKPFAWSAGLKRILASGVNTSVAGSLAQER
jgi:hypothetical protein